MATYGDEEMLMLSGIQHYAFCPRQRALIHIEQQWHENHLTIEGAYFHERVDDPLQTNLLRGCVVLRSVPLKSSRLGLYGVSDVVALYPASESENAVAHPRYPGNWAPRPVEYKKGKPKEDDILHPAREQPVAEQVFRAAQFQARRGLQHRSRHPFRENQVVRYRYRNRFFARNHHRSVGVIGGAPFEFRLPPHLTFVGAAVEIDFRYRQAVVAFDLDDLYIVVLF